MVSVPYAFRGARSGDAWRLARFGICASESRRRSRDCCQRTDELPQQLSPKLAVPMRRRCSPVTGSGKKNFIPIWTSSTTLESSALFQSGGNVGLGTTTPGAKLDVLASPGANVGGGINARGGSYGLSGSATAVSGYTVGVYGQNASNSGAGVNGTASATSGYTSGVYGQSSSITGVGWPVIPPLPTAKQEACMDKASTGLEWVAWLPPPPAVLRTACGVTV